MAKQDLLQVGLQAILVWILMTLGLNTTFAAPREKYQVAVE
jgi:hypothetical protein